MVACTRVARIGHLHYNVHMRTTLTIRTDPELRKALEERAFAQGKTVSALAREILREALDERPMELRTGHLRGRLRLGGVRSGSWREVLRERNWRS
jgi:plasmid stability protein